MPDEPIVLTPDPTPIVVVPPAPKSMKGAKMLPIVGLRFDINGAFVRTVLEAMQSGRTTLVVVDATPDAARESYGLTVAIAEPDPPIEDSLP